MLLRLKRKAFGACGESVPGGQPLAQEMAELEQQLRTCVTVGSQLPPSEFLLDRVASIMALTRCFQLAVVVMATPTAESVDGSGGRTVLLDGLGGFRSVRSGVSDSRTSIMELTPMIMHVSS
jgi:hypothetical protein